MTMWQGLVRLPGVHLQAVQARDWVHAQGGAAHAGAAPTPAASGGAAGVRVLHGADEPLTYLRVPLSAPLTAGDLDAWRQAAQALAPGAEVALLRGTTDLPGASDGQAAPWHYIVETDVAEGVEADLDAWYETEHLPGLASVPGTVRAQRFVDDAGSPRHHASYDLNTRETFGSPPWLAVRATAWSDRVRPHFRHTRRTMFRVVG